MALKDKLRIAREEKGISQQRAADHMGISITYYRQLESGERDNPTLFVMQIMADYYNKTLDELFYDDSGGRINGNKI